VSEGENMHEAAGRRAAAVIGEAQQDSRVVALMDKQHEGAVCS
jgi:hypothetical protein